MKVVSDNTMENARITPRLLKIYFKKRKVKIMILILGDRATIQACQYWYKLTYIRLLEIGLL